MPGGNGLAISGIVLSLGLFLASGAYAQEIAAAPDASSIFEEAGTSPSRLIFQEDFEGSPPIKMEQWYNAEVPSKTLFSGVTAEQAFSGKHAYKVEIRFEPGRWGSAYFRLPVQIPLWSDLSITMHVKAQAPLKTWFFHGPSWGDAEEGFDGNLVQGKKKSEANGWEVWQVTARKGQGAGQFLSGLSINFQLPDHSPASTVTLYVDNVTVAGKLPSNWKDKWAAIHRYFTVDGEKVKRAASARRVKAMKTWYGQCRREFQKLSLPSNASRMVAEQYKALVAGIQADLNSVRPMLDAIDKALEDSKARFNVNPNPPERILMQLRHRLDIAASYADYARRYPDADWMTFTLDITQSYPILPEGPMAHNEELSYYSWDQKGSELENPQILPDTTPVPAYPSRTLTGFGCRGTYIPLSFVLRANKEFRKPEFALSDLKSARAAIPASALDLRVVAPWYRPFNGKPRLMSELLLHDPEFVTPVQSSRSNKFKDPQYGNDADHLLGLSIPAGTNRQFYLTVKVPETTPGGIYTGKLEAKINDGKSICWEVSVEVLSFDLETTPFAYNFFYCSWLKDRAFKKAQGIHSLYKTIDQMEADFKSMAEHGCNTLHLPCYTPVKKANGWDFSELGQCLAAGKRVGLTRSPFVLISHNVPFIIDNRWEELKTWDSVLAIIKERVAAVNEFCRTNKYPRPVFFGHDEASGEVLVQLTKGYTAVNRAGGIVTAACYPGYFSEIGTALSLPIVYGGAQTLMGQRNIQASQKAGHECWIYNCPCTNMAASPSVYRRRYGLALWKNGEQGAAPWEYCGMSTQRTSRAGKGYEVISFDDPVYAVAYPTWSGKPIDTIIYEAWREGIYDTRYLATLQKHLKKAKDRGLHGKLVSRIDHWLNAFSIHEDLQGVRRQMANYTLQLMDSNK